jgi:hypothetical protein
LIIEHCSASDSGLGIDLYADLTVQDLGKYHVVIHNLHKKYGPVVRIAPNIVDLDLPELVKTYIILKGTGKKMRRGCFHKEVQPLREETDRILSWK